MKTIFRTCFLAGLLLAGACGDDSSDASGTTTGTGGHGAGTTGSGGSGAHASGGGGAGGGGTAGGGAGVPSNIIPDDRLITWIGNVGVEGGIPERTTQIDCTAPPYSAHADGSDTADAIQACLEGIAEDEVAYLPAGTYALAGPLSIPSHKSLRGDGPAATVLQFVADLDADVQIVGGYTDGTDGGIAITSGFTKGSTELVLASDGGIAPGDFVYVSELNDATIPVVVTNDNGACDWCGIYGSNGSRARLQLAKVTAVSGSTITIDPPMYFTFSSANAPEVLKAPSYVQYAGVESLTIQNVGNSYSSQRKPLLFQGAASSWAKNVKVDKCGSRCIDLWFDVYRNEIRDSYITNCFDQDSSDNCYGLQIENGSGNLVENVIFDATANGILLVSASGNAFGYNFMHAVHRTASVDTWFWPVSWTHGGHSSFNVWEGNDMSGLEWDYYWGSNSHDLAFRNRLRGVDETVTYDLPNLQTVGAILTYPNNHYMTAVGNVLGTSGFHDLYEETQYAVVSRPIWATIHSAFGTTTDQPFTTLLRHMNHDAVTDSVKRCDDAGEPGCLGGDGSSVVPASYYLAGKPAFFGAVAWPAVGPDVDGLAKDIPAAACFQKTTGSGLPFDAADCY